MRFFISSCALRLLGEPRLVAFLSRSMMLLPCFLVAAMLDQILDQIDGISRRLGGQWRLIIVRSRLQRASSWFELAKLGKMLTTGLPEIQLDSSDTIPV